MIRRLLPVALVLVAVASADLSGWLRSMNAMLGDVRMSAGTRPPTGTIVLVDIDSKSLTAIGRWPWPRRVYADLTDRLRADGVSEIAYDVDFSSTSSQQDDSAFEAALVRARASVILAMFKQRESGKAGGSIVTTMPQSRFAQHAWLAEVNVVPDPDGTVRKIGYGDQIDGVVVSSLAAVLGGGPGSWRDEFAVDYSIDAGAIDRVSVIDVLSGTVDASRIRGKKVIVGAEALELRDLFRVPVHGFVSGSMLQALAAETLIQGRALGSSGLVLTIFGLLAVAAIVFAAIARLSWLRLVLILLSLGVLIELAATVIQWYAPVSMQTAAWQVAIAVFAVFVLVREIDFRRVLLTISRTQTRNATAILDRVIDDNFAGVLVVDATGEVRAASRAAEEILGRRNLLGQAVAGVLPAGLLTAVQTALHSEGDGSSGPREIAVPADGGTVRYLEYVVTPSRMAGGLAVDGRSVGDGVVACLTFSDITEKKLAAEQVERLARFDTLTGLANRNEFLSRLERALVDRSVTVVCIDVDRFKVINETLGHDVGDLLLIAVARRIQAEAGPEALVARLGSDNFAVLSAGAGAEGRAQSLVAALVDRAGDPFELGPHRAIAALSIGIASDDFGRNGNSLLKFADIALNRAREGGGNRWMRFAPIMTAGVARRQAMEQALWLALERGEFSIHYQPQVDLGTGKIVGVEALLRWSHRALGDVPPTEFVAVAEAIGLIQPLGDWVLRTACAEVATWPEPVRLAVNVSTMQFLRGDVVASVAGALAVAGLPADRLDIEITESILMADNAEVAEIIASLSALGVRLALDDFGTGYSSLAYITRLPISKVKLDRSFLTNFPRDAAAVAVVQAVGSLAGNLGIELNAEGVESAEQVLPLRLLGCKEGQGYLFGKPMLPSALLPLLGQRRTLAAAS